MAALVVDADHGDVSGRVPRGVDRDDPPVVGERPAAREGAERAAVQRERLEVHARRHGLAQHALEEPGAGRLRERQLGFVDEHGPAEVDRPIHVVAVHVGQHDCVDGVEAEAGRLQGAGQLLLGGDVEPRERDVPHAGRLPRVDEQQAAVMLDGPAVHGQGI